MYDTILLPTDGSREMTEVVDQAVKLAAMCDATIHALHVVDERAYLSVPADARERVRSTLAADGEAATEAVAERASEAGLDVVRELRRGDPAASILSYAVENGVDAVVMGTHGRTGYERYLLGSVAERVVRAAPLPVLTVAVGDTEGRVEDIAAAPVGEGTGGPAELGGAEAPATEEEGEESGESRSP